jgi:hypothetical protein
VARPSGTNSARARRPIVAHRRRAVTKGTGRSERKLRHCGCVSCRCYCIVGESQFPRPFDERKSDVAPQLF